jgi:hypothetical protein
MSEGLKGCKLKFAWMCHGLLIAGSGPAKSPAYMYASHVCIYVNIVCAKPGRTVAVVAAGKAAGKRTESCSVCPERTPCSACLASTVE